jgi:hypothetical protein
VCFEMEVRGLSRDAAAEAPEETLRASLRAAVLSDALLAAYCILRDAPEEVVGERRQRYATMGALMVAQDALCGTGEPAEATA